ncbi:MAG TPA: hypothetical protein VKZ96_01370 [Thermomicrobiales bacterium]|nr:hypothetical protein [Thermomicrobiales bacterium]
MIKIKFRRTPAPPIEPKLQRPQQVGAMLFTLRSVPRHHDPIRAIIDNHSGSRVWFSEPLAYLRGQGVSLFRVEATDLGFLDELYRWWAETERSEAFSFDINLFFNDRDWVASLREHTPEEVRRIIEQHAPRVTEEDLKPVFMRDRA